MTSFISGSLEAKADTELRYLSAQHRHQLAQILDGNNAWKSLASIIKNPDSMLENDPLFTTPTINILERQLISGKSPTDAMLLYWSTYGRHRPTIRVLLEYLTQAGIHRAVDFVCKTILNIENVNEVLSAQNLHSSLDEQRKESQSTDLPSSKTSDCSSYEMIDNENLSNSSSCSFDSESGSKIKSHPVCQKNPAKRTYDVENIFAFHNLDTLLKQIDCDRYSFDSIYKSTNGFCHKPYHLTHGTGTKLGEGRFSCVFKADAIIERSSTDRKENSSNNCDPRIVAAKLLKAQCNQRFLIDEINLVRTISHDNILRFLGISIVDCNNMGSSYLCLIYDFMCNGSLLDRLACRFQTDPLGWHQRLTISIGVARGLAYLHNLGERPIIHRDIKSANVFLDANMEAKVGDFTLVRQLESRLRTQSNGNSNGTYNDHNDCNDYSESLNGPVTTSTTQLMTQMTQNIMGTSIYMPVEAFRGDISVKFDTFSFGVVLLELITGMKPFDEIKQMDILTYVNEELAELDEQISSKQIHISTDTPDSLISSLSLNNDQATKETLLSSRVSDYRECHERAKDEFLTAILDTKAGQWDFNVARSLFQIALLATETRKKTRPTMSQVLPMLETLESML